MRLHQGRYDAVTVYDEDPPARARAWRGKVPWLHVVDLEGAREGRPVQREQVRAVVDAFGPGVEVGGGVRTRESFEAYRALGAARVVLGSAAVKDAELVRALALEHPGVVDRRGRRAGRLRRRRRVDAADARAGGRPGPIVRRRAARRGPLHGRRARRHARRARTSRRPRSSRPRRRCRSSRPGGVGSLDDLRTLAARGISACIVGRALYDGTFTLDEALEAALA